MDHPNLGLNIYHDYFLRTQYFQVGQLVTGRGYYRFCAVSSFWGICSGPKSGGENYSFKNMPSRSLAWVLHT